MNIESLSPGIKVSQGINTGLYNGSTAQEANKQPAHVDSLQAPAASDSKKSVGDTTESKLKLDEATGIMQSITVEPVTDKVIRKMPTDEYLHLQHLLDGIINGSVDKKI